MHKIVRLSLLLVIIVFITAWPASSGTRKGDVLINRARQMAAKDTTADLEIALKLAEEALATDRTDIAYQLEAARLRAFAAQYHVYDGQVLRDKRKLKEALVEFEKATEMDPASIVAPQEAKRVRDALKVLETNPNAIVEDLLRRPLSENIRRRDEQFSNTAPVPRLKLDPNLSPAVIKVNNQLSGEVFLAAAKELNLRVVFDPDYQPRPLGLNQTLDFRGLNAEQALDYVALCTRSFWKPLGSDTVFVTNDDITRRANYEEQVTKAFYLTNAPSAQEVNDIASTVQRITDMKRLFVHPEQNVIVVRGEADRVALAEKLIADLDKSKAEIIVDVVIMSVTKDWLQNLGVVLGFDTSGSNNNGGLNTNFGPRASIGGANGRIPLTALKQLGLEDFNITLPGQAVNAFLQNTGAKVLDKAQLRTVEGQKSTLRIGQKQPYATGSFAPGAAGGGVSTLVSTQFQFYDVGLNIDVLAKVHEPDEVSLHIESDQSAFVTRVDLGGVQQPIISQRKRIADVRVKEGEVNLWDVVTERQDLNILSGVPGLSQIPVVGRIFSSNKVEKIEQYLITLLIPHIIRAPDVQEVNLLGVPSGSDSVVRMRYNSPLGPVSQPRLEEARLVELPPGPPPTAFAVNGGMGMNGVMGTTTMGAAPMGMTNPMAGTMGMTMPMGATTMGATTMGATPMGATTMGATPMGATTMGATTPMNTMGMAAPAVGGMNTIPPAPPVAAVPQQLGAVQFLPPIASAGVNEIIPVEVKLSGTPDLREGTVQIEFDPKALKLTKYAPDALAANLTGGVGQLPEEGKILVRLRPSPNGGGAVMKLEFQLLTAGRTQVRIGNIRLVGAQGQELPALTPALEISSK